MWYVDIDREVLYDVSVDQPYTITIFQKERLCARDTPIYNECDMVGRNVCLAHFTQTRRHFLLYLLYILRFSRCIGYCDGSVYTFAAAISASCCAVIAALRDSSYVVSLRSAMRRSTHTKRAFKASLLLWPAFIFRTCSSNSWVSDCLDVAMVKSHFSGVSPTHFRILRTHAFFGSKVIHSFLTITITA